MIGRLERFLRRFSLARRQIGIGDLPEGGRSSVPSYRDQFASSLTAAVNGYIAPRVPFALTDALERASIYNPDISNAVSRFRNLANTGHTLVIDGTARAVERAIDALNETAYRAYQRSAGVDGLVNHLLDQVIVTGAVCCEDVVDTARFQLKEIAIVPTTSIRFRQEDGELRPYQKTSRIEGFTTDLVPLNPVTFAMFNLQVWGDSPYPKSPFTAVLEPLILQRAAMQNVEFILRKIGLLGLLRVALTVPPQKGGESDQAYESRKGMFLRKALEAFSANFRQGLMVGYKDHEIEHFNVTSDARGARDVFQIVEEQICSGLDIDPAMLGRSYSTTETYAGVVYNACVRNAINIRRMPKRRLERSYRLDLGLRGIEVDGVSIKFDKISALNPLSEAQAENARVRMVIEKARAGVADPDELAQELGYDSWFDVARLERSGGLFGLKRTTSRGMDETSRGFRFDQSRQRYRFERPSIRLAPLDPAGPSLEDFIAQVRRYLETVAPYMEQAREAALERAVSLLAGKTAADFPSAEEFAGAVLREVRSGYRATMASEESRAAAAGAIGQIYLTFKQVADIAGLGEWDERTIGWLGNLDNFFLSKFVDNHGMREPVLNFLRERFLEDGEGLFGRLKPETVAAFRDMFGDRLTELANYQVKNIINHSVQRMRNWSHGQMMREAAVEYAEIVAVMDDRTSDICKTLHGKRIPIGTAMGALDRVLEFSPEEYLQHLEQIKPAEYFPNNAAGDVLEKIAADGRGFPPYHPGPCRTRLKAVVE